MRDGNPNPIDRNRRLLRSALSHAGLALAWGLGLLFLTMSLAPGLLVLGARVTCPRGTEATIVGYQTRSITRRSQGRSYEVWCLDDGGAGGPISSLGAYAVLYGYEVLAAGGGLALYRVVKIIGRRRRA